MTAPPPNNDNGWSTPSLYTGGRMFEPRTFTEADPMSTFLFTDWSQPSVTTRHEGQWGATTYVGKRRLRTRPISPEEARGPSTEAAAEAVEGDRSVLTASRTMAVASLVSRITGFLRSSMLVAAIGVGQVGDAYNVANNFPNMVYELLLGGVLSSVLIPLLVHAQESDEDDGIAYTQRLLSVATAALGGMTFLAVLSAPLLAAGFVPGGDQRSLASIFATLLLPEIFFYGLGAMFMAVLNIRHSFAPGAWSPVLNNVVMILTLVVFWSLPGPSRLTASSITTSQVLVLGLGTTLGIAAQALVLIPALRRSGFHWKWRFRARPNELGRMREVGSLAGWVFGYVVASQIGVTVIAKVGVSHKAFTIFTNADLLVQMPYGILVVSLLTALMPRLSRSAARGDTEAVVSDLGLGARLSAVALIPITAGFIVLGPVLSVVLFGYGVTSIQGARQIGIALAASAFGLFPFALLMLQLRVFYAMRDGRTPTLINIGLVAAKVLIVIVAGATLDTGQSVAIALTVATSASYVVGAVAGHILLTNRFGPLGFGAVAATTARISVASAIGGLAAYLIVSGCESAFGAGHVGSATGLAFGGLAGLGVMGVIVWRMRLREIQDILGLIRR